MYRGSRLAASFLLVLTGAAVIALGIGAVPAVAAADGARLLVPLVVAFGVAHVVALAGVARGRAWGRTLALSIAESGGGLAFAAAIAHLLGADPLATGHSGTAVGFAAWMVALYVLLGFAVGRMRLSGWARLSRWWPAPLLRPAA